MCIHTAHRSVGLEDDFVLSITLVYWLHGKLKIPIIVQKAIICDLIVQNHAQGPHAPRNCPVKPGPVIFEYSTGISEIFPHVRIVMSYNLVADLYFL